MPRADSQEEKNRCQWLDCSRARTPNSLFCAQHSVPPENPDQKWFSTVLKCAGGGVVGGAAWDMIRALTEVASAFAGTLFNYRDPDETEAVGVSKFQIQSPGSLVLSFVTMGDGSLLRNETLDDTQIELIANRLATMTANAEIPAAQVREAIGAAMARSAAWPQPHQTEPSGVFSA